MRLNQLHELIAVRFSLALLLSSLSAACLTLALFHLYGAHGLVVALELYVMLRAIMALFNVTRFAGLDVQKISLGEVVPLVVMCLLLHFLISGSQIVY